MISLYAPFPPPTKEMPMNGIVIVFICLPEISQFLKKAQKIFNYQDSIVMAIKFPIKVKSNLILII